MKLLKLELGRMLRGRLLVVRPLAGLVETELGWGWAEDEVGMIDGTVVGWAGSCWAWLLGSWVRRRMVVVVDGDEASIMIVDDGGDE